VPPLDAPSANLALVGGPPTRTDAAPGWPVFEADEIAASSNVLASGRVNYWTGEEGRAFEREFAAFVGTRHAIAVSNGTVALELALHALGIGPGDEVIVPSRTFIATASAVVAVGARPRCADVDRDSGNITAETIAAAITLRTRAVIVVHLGGWPADVDAILELCRGHGIVVVEDCAQAHGAELRGRRVGSLGQVAAFSFCQDKIMTTGGEGGMITTSDDDIWELMWSRKDHGKDYATVHRTDHPPGFRWLHARFGTNARLTEMQSAIGRAQLRKLPSWVAKRRHNASRLLERLANVPGIEMPWPGDEVFHSHYRAYLRIDITRLRGGWDRDRFVQAVAAEGVACMVGSCSEIQRERAFEGFDRPVLPVAAELGRTSVALLVHHTLRDVDIDLTAAAVQKVASFALRG
jgi:dTDP-4-amino-4,6-dideoxygalactose transaminase